MLEKKKYNHLTPIEIAYKKGRVNYWLCECDCGKNVIAREPNIKNGHTKSCGCLRVKKIKEMTQSRRSYNGLNNPKFKHGRSREKIYRTWANMKQRCLNPNAHEFSAYGGRGIKIYDEWIEDFESFYNYVSSLPHYGEKERSIDRINNNGNYEPGNIRWATSEEQYKNRGY